MKNQRFYNFMIIIYSEDEKFTKQLESLCKYDYIYIKHDNDLKEDSEELKKEHYHVIVRFKNARTISALAKECDISENMIEPCKSLTASLKYLVHYKNDNKYQYSVDDVISNCNLLDRLKKLVYEDISEDEKAYTLFEFIQDTDGYLSFESFFAYVCKTNQYSVYRRDSYSFVRLLENHNQNYINL